MFLIANGGVYVAGRDLKQGDIIALVDLPEGLQKNYNRRAFTPVTTAEAREKIDAGEARFVRLGDATLDAPVVDEVVDEAPELERILDNNIANASSLIAQIDDIETLEELRELEVNLDGRKGIFNAIDDRIGKLAKDPTPSDAPVHVIEDTRMGIAETEL